MSVPYEDKLDHLRRLMRLHDEFWLELAWRSPSEALRLFLNESWGPVMNRWRRLEASGQMWDPPNPTNMIDRVANELSLARATADERGIPIPDLGTAQRGWRPGAFPGPRSPQDGVELYARVGAGAGVSYAERLSHLRKLVEDHDRYWRPTSWTNPTERKFFTETWSPWLWTFHQIDGSDSAYDDGGVIIPAVVDSLARGLSIVREFAQGMGIPLPDIQHHEVPMQHAIGGRFGHHRRHHHHHQSQQQQQQQEDAGQDGGGGGGGGGGGAYGYGMPGAQGYPGMPGAPGPQGPQGPQPVPPSDAHPGAPAGQDGVVSGRHGGGFHGGGFHGGAFHGGGGRERRQFFGTGGGGWGPWYGSQWPYDDGGEAWSEEESYSESVGVDPAPSTPTPPILSPLPLERGAKHRRRSHGDVGLAEATSALSPGSDDVSVHAKLGSDLVLRISLCVDGQRYDGAADLSEIIAQITERVASFHQSLHERDPASTPPPAESPLAISETRNEVNEATVAAGEILVGSLLDRHQRTVSAGWWHSLTHGISSAVDSVRTTIRKHKGVISTLAATAAGAAATVTGGPMAGAAAAKLADAAVEASSGDDPKKKAAAHAVLKQAAQQAAQDPAVAAAVDHASRAVSQAAGIVHIASTAMDAAGGDRKAQRALVEMGSAALAGDPAAKQGMDVVNAIAPGTFPGGEDPIAITQGVPWLAFGAAGAGVAGLWWWMHRKNEQRKRAAQEAVRRSLPASDAHAAVASGAQARPASREDRAMQGAQSAALDFYQESGARFIGCSVTGDGGQSVSPSGSVVTMEDTVYVELFSSMPQMQQWSDRQARRPGCILVASFDTQAPAWPQPIHAYAPARGRVWINDANAANGNHPGHAHA